MMQLPIKNKMAYIGLILAFTLILSYVEVLIPSFLPIPGFKLGIANLGVILCMQLLGDKEAILIAVLKAVLSSLLFGNAMVLIYSLSGALFSCIIMILLKKINIFSIIIISGAGGISHNMFQLLICYLFYESNGLSYFIPFLIMAGLITGIIVGLIEVYVEPYIIRIIKEY